MERATHRGRLTRDFDNLESALSQRCEIRLIGGRKGRDKQHVAELNPIQRTCKYPGPGAAGYLNDVQLWNQVTEMFLGGCHLNIWEIGARRKRAKLGTKEADHAIRMLANLVRKCGQEKPITDTEFTGCALNACGILNRDIC